MSVYEKYTHESGLPAIRVNGDSIRIADAIVALGFAKSCREAKQLIKDGAVKIGKKNV